MIRRVTARSCGLTLVLLAITAAGWAGRLSAPVQAEVRPTLPPPHLQSGGARSEVVLQQIAGILERIEGRLQRIEELAARWDQGTKPAARSVRP
jgi:hypothetical protein